MCGGKPGHTIVVIVAYLHSVAYRRNSYIAIQEMQRRKILVHALLIGRFIKRLGGVHGARGIDGTTRLAPGRFNLDDLCTPISQAAAGGGACYIKGAIYAALTKIAHLC